MAYSPGSLGAGRTGHILDDEPSQARGVHRVAQRFLTLPSSCETLVPSGRQRPGPGAVQCEGSCHAVGDSLPCDGAGDRIQGLGGGSGLDTGVPERTATSMLRNSGKRKGTEVVSNSVPVSVEPTAPPTTGEIRYPIHLRPRDIDLTSHCAPIMSHHGRRPKQGREEV